MPPNPKSRVGAGEDPALLWETRQNERGKTLWKEQKGGLDSFNFRRSQILQACREGWERRRREDRANPTHRTYEAERLAAETTIPLATTPA
jgi:hypothetical protein